MQQIYTRWGHVLINSPWELIIRGNEYISRDYIIILLRRSLFIDSNLRSPAIEQTRMRKLIQVDLGKFSKIVEN